MSEENPEQPPESPSSKSPEGITERPLECSECKKTIAVHYTEIIGNNTTNTYMCSDCPILQQKLCGTDAVETTGAALENHTGLCCGNCDTTLAAVRTGCPIGCMDCYDVFGDVIILEMLSSKKISPRLSPEKSSSSRPFHVGRSPGEAAAINPSLRLIALNEALNETLAHEDYEQAAWLRDQINELSDKAGSIEQSESPDEQQ